MPGQTPAATVTLSKEGTVTNVPVRAKCTVTYEFDTTATKADLALPFAISVNGRVIPTHAEKPDIVRGSPKKIMLAVEAGSQVALFLNSDAHPDHRRNPVYAVQVGTNDVLVKVKEVTGRKSHLRSSVGLPVTRSSGKPGKRLDEYETFLTGDIWMEISHVYSAAEADALMTPDVAPAVRDAVLDIYAGLREPRVVVRKLSLTMLFLEQMQHNTLQNTTHCPWLTGILTRTHPLAYAALLTEAHAAGITEVRVTSAWRPCTGSIAHRAGLGLDVSYVESDHGRLRLNRAALKTGKTSPDDNVSEREHALYREYTQKRARADDLQKRLRKDQSTVAHTTDPGERSRLQLDISKTQIELEAAEEHAVRANKRWREEMARSEPTMIKSLREQLIMNPAIKQIFDPWYMERNTMDQELPTANAQITKNEQLHNDHLHLTVLDPKILP